MGSAHVYGTCALCAFAIALAPSALLAAPLAEDPALAKTSTLSVSSRPLSQALAELSGPAGVPLTVDDHLAWTPIAIGAHECPVRDLMAAIAATTRLEWQKEGGRYRLTGCAVVPPVADTRRLIPRLAAALPQWMRPAPGPMPSTDGRAIAESLYASLRGELLETVEDGGSILLADLPPAARQGFTQYHRAVARVTATQALQPDWLGFADALGIRLNHHAWELVAPVGEGAQGGPWRLVGWLPYSPMPRPQEPSSPDAPLLDNAALALSKRESIPVVLSAFLHDPEEAHGDTPEKLLVSILPASGRERYRWQREGKAYWLQDTRQERRPAEEPALARCRDLMKAALPAQYGPLLAMGSSQRHLAIGAAGAALWRSLTAEQRGEGRVTPAAELTREQQHLLYASLQLQMVNTLWSAAESVLGSDERRALVSLDFEIASPYLRAAGIGYPRRLRVLDGEDVILDPGGLESPPAMLPLLPGADPIQARRVEFEAKDEPLGDVVARLSERLGAPLAAREPEGEAKLTGEFRGRPARVVLHWLERRTGLQWRKRGAAYVLAPDAGEAIAGANVEQTLRALLQDYPEAQPGAVGKQITEADRASLLKGDTALSELSPGLQDAIRGHHCRTVRGGVEAAGADWRKLQRLGQGRIRLDGARLILDIPGVPEETLDTLPAPK